jgi:hypothetical protein
MARTVLRVKAGLMAKMGLLAVMARTAKMVTMEIPAFLSSAPR